MRLSPAQATPLKMLRSRREKEKELLGALLSALGSEDDDEEDDFC